MGEFTKTITIGQVEEFPVQLGRVVQVGEERICVFRLSDGSMCALEDISPHRGGPISEGIVSGKYVYDPLYDWKICLESGQVQEPDTGQVKIYQLQVIGDIVTVNME
ncbi:nitrite reductase (NAD(P)H) small subunit [Brevibacillus laterosporus]|uniref:nitrite reductase (NAD(P)H) small subunit n=1 Tax=Brevibacillus laterosporus TaxID=1465 RepID=UPI00036FAE8B|nr:nitrite reductase (NAD(P)H) small subunit [Brevibacillus laterosporus]ATO50363.1 nitrite reductase [Brevibacillus laterosporus DSM 25]MED2004935.1 nitrite reductase (NAD(P)H) small subunit [Brevibacillus laterosporus]